MGDPGMSLGDLNAADIKHYVIHIWLQSIGELANSPTNGHNLHVVYTQILIG